MTSVRSYRASRPTSTAGRLLVLLAALGGLFFMHGLADHGVAHHATMGAPDASSKTTMGADHVAAPDTFDPSGVDAAADGDQTPSDSGMALAGLCLAVLAGIVASVLTLRLLGRGWLLPALRPASAVRVLGARARDPVAPDLVSLCIQRC